MVGLRIWLAVVLLAAAALLSFTDQVSAQWTDVKNADNYLITFNVVEDEHEGWMEAGYYDSSPYIHRHLQIGKTYHYAVRAHNNVGYSDWSDLDCDCGFIRPTGDPTPVPSTVPQPTWTPAPTSTPDPNQGVKPVIIEMNAIDETTNLIRWRRVRDAVRYHLQYRWETAPYWTNWIDTPKTTDLGYTHSGLTQGRIYQYRVSALAAGDVMIGSWSDTAQITLPHPTPVPVPPTATPEPPAAPYFATIMPSCNEPYWPECWPYLYPWPKSGSLGYTQLGMTAPTLTESRSRSPSIT